LEEVRLLSKEKPRELEISRDSGNSKQPSSDDNIECNAWALLKVRLQKRQQDPSKRFNTKEEFIQAAQEEWEKLDWAAVDKLIDSMN
jgi:hypothetical protein